jgi:NADPH-dependent curcumin reductase CurA
MTINRQILLREQPEGTLEESHYELREGSMPEPGDGEILVRTLIISIDAANRAWMQGATYRKEMTGGSVMDGYGIGQVVASNADGVAPGDIVGCEVGWQDYSVHLARRVIKLPADYRPLSHFISLFGIAGQTAWHGLMQVGRPEEGETVLVSAAAGSVGQYVGQIAKAKGCTAIGIASGPEKCAFITDELGFDACIDYKNEHVRSRIAELAPKGIDIYFDNVGAEILEAALFNMAERGRVVCCGAISQYDTTEMTSPRGLPGLIVFKRLRMEGFIVTDFYRENDKANADMAAMHGAGQIKVVEDILDGLDQAPKGLIGLLAGDNIGKRMIRVAPDPE